MRNDWQKKEKKEKKKKKEEASESDAGDAGGGGDEGGSKAKAPVGNVFALFKQAQIQEFKEVWSL